MKEDDALRLRRKVRHANQSAGLGIARFVDSGGERTQIRSEQRRQRTNTDTLGRTSEKLTPRQVEIDFVFAGHCLLMVSSRLKITLATVV